MNKVTELKGIAKHVALCHVERHGQSIPVQHTPTAPASIKVEPYRPARFPVQFLSTNDPAEVPERVTRPFYR